MPLAALVALSHSSRSEHRQNSGIWYDTTTGMVNAQPGIWMHSIGMMRLSLFLSLQSVSFSVCGKQNEYFFWTASLQLAIELLFLLSTHQIHATFTTQLIFMKAK